MLPTSDESAPVARNLSHMPPFRRIAAACAAAALLTAGAVPAWGDSRHHLRHEKRHAGHQAAQLDERARQQAAHVARSRADLARLNDRATVALAELQKAGLAADRARDANDAAQAALAQARQRTLTARAQLN